MEGVTVTFYNGTSLYDAGNETVVASIYDRFAYDALNGNQVFVHVKGIYISNLFNMTARLLITMTLKP